MKKLLMSLAVLAAAAGIASASSITWGGGPALDKDGNNLGTGTAYLVYLGENGTVDAKWNSESASWEMGDDQIVDSTSLMGAATTSYTGSWGYYMQTSGVNTGIGAKYAVIIASEGVSGTTLPGQDQGYYGISSEIFTQTKADVTDEEFFNQGVITVDQPLPGPGPVPPPPVPEPTTYALIGVAAAALALRKRFMKK